MWLSLIDTSVVNFLDLTTAAASRRSTAATEEALAASDSAMKSLAEVHPLWQLSAATGTETTHTFVRAVSHSMECDVHI